MKHCNSIFLFALSIFCLTEISYMSPTVRMVNLKEKNTFQLLFRITRG